MAAESGPASRRQEGQPGNLLCHARTVRRVCAPAARRRRYGRRIGRYRRHRSRRARGDRRASPSASERAWASRSASGSLSCGSSPSTRRVVIGDRAELDRRELTARGCNWLAFDRDDVKRPIRSAAMHKFATTHQPNRPTLTVLPRRTTARRVRRAAICRDAGASSRLLRCRRERARSWRRLD